MQGRFQIFGYCLAQLIVADTYRLVISSQGILCHDLILTPAQQKTDGLVIIFSPQFIIYNIDIEI